MPIELRPYQHEALKAINDGIARGVRRPLLGLPTGTGKTVIFSALIAERGGSALVLAHREELIDQAARKLKQIAPTLEIGIVKADRDEYDKPVVVASVQTLRPSRLERLRHDFTTVVVDEAHHAAADSYLRILKWVEASPLILGVTATPERADRRTLGEVWDEIVYSRDILEMIRGGFLSDLRGLRVQLDVDFSKLRVSHGDFVDSESAALLTAASAPAHACQAFIEHARDRRGLIFTPTVELAYEMAETFRDAGIACEALDGTVPLVERRAILARLRSGETQVVANCAVLTEGFDESAIDCVIIARPTRSRPLYTQMIGRGTRTFLNKTDCLIIDLVGATERFDLLTLPNLFNLKPHELMATDSVREAADRQVEVAAIEQAETIAHEVDLFRKRRELAWVQFGSRWVLELGKGKLWIEPYAEAWRVIHETEALKRALIATDVDLGYAHGIATDLVEKLGLHALVDADARWRENKMTEKQANFIRNLGGTPDPGLSRGEASELITRLKAQRGFVAQR